MKKLSLLIALVMVVAILVAAIPTKMVRLTVINKSGYDVYIKLTGSPISGAFYYLTIPTGDRDKPTVKVFTILSDVYERETWQCGGFHNTGTMWVDGNIRLTFIPCGDALCAVWRWWLFPVWKCGVVDFVYVDKQWKEKWQGEPRFEKVAYWKYFSSGSPSWINAYKYDGFLNYGCFTWYYRFKTYQLPTGCLYRYQY